MPISKADTKKLNGWEGGGRLIGLRKLCPTMHAAFFLQPGESSANENGQRTLGPAANFVPGKSGARWACGATFGLFSSMGIAGIRAGARHFCNMRLTARKKVTRNGAATMANVSMMGLKMVRPVLSPFEGKQNLKTNS